MKGLRSTSVLPIFGGNTRERGIKNHLIVPPQSPEQGTRIALTSDPVKDLPNRSGAVYPVHHLLL
jgi:hypothetical protein